MPSSTPSYRLGALPADRPGFEEAGGWGGRQLLATRPGGEDETLCAPRVTDGCPTSLRAPTLQGIERTNPVTAV